MISMQEAYGWLNRVGKSRLQNDMRINFFQLEDGRISLAQRARLANDIRINSQQIVDKMERLEVLVSLGYIFANWKKWDDSDMAFRDAIDGYQKVSHEWAVANWLRGVVQWKKLANSQAYAHWFQARDAFLKCHANRVTIADTQMSLWYTQVIEKIRVEMAKTVEEADFWLNFHETSRLTPQAKQLSDRIVKDIRAGNFIEAYEFGNYLVAINRGRLDMRETAEAWEKVGLAAWQMGNPRKAIEYWKRGVSAYEPMSHQSATIKWMVGIAEWSLPTEYENAMKHCQDVVDSYGYCQSVADRSNRQAEREWFQRTIPIMRIALEELRKEKMGI
jgi:tetratricopeptide (TPR) repeat protein